MVYRYSIYCKPNINFPPLTLISSSPALSNGVQRLPELAEYAPEKEAEPKRSSMPPYQTQGRLWSGWSRLWQDSHIPYRGEQMV